MRTQQIYRNIVRQRIGSGTAGPGRTGANKNTGLWHQVAAAR